MPPQCGLNEIRRARPAIPQARSRMAAPNPAGSSRRDTHFGALAALTAVVLLAAIPAGAHTPHDPVNFLAVSDTFDVDGTAFIVVHNELKRTVDGGATWHRLEQGICGLGKFSGLAASERFSVDRSLVASRTGDGLYASHDGGDSWRRLAVLPRGLGPVIVVAGTGPVDRPAGFAAVDPGGRLLVSQDAGETWSSVQSPGAAPASLAMATGPGGEPRLAVGTGEGVVLYTGDRGLTWERVAPGAAGEPVVMLAFEPETGASLVGLAGSGQAFRWRPSCAADPDCAGPGLNRLGFAGGPVSAGHLSARGDAGVNLVAARRDGEIVAGPAGSGWRPESVGVVPYEGQAEKFHLPQVTQISGWTGDGLCVAAFSGLHCQTGSGAGFAERQSIDPHEITGLAVAPDRDGRSLAVATFNAGGWVSEDGGESWSRLPPGAVTDHFWAVTWPPGSCGVAGPVFVGNRGLIWFDAPGNTWHLRTPRNDEPDFFDRAVGALQRMLRDVPPPKPRPKVFGTVAVSGGTADDCRIWMGTRYEGVWSYELTDGVWDALGPSAQRTRVSSIVRAAGSQGLAASFVGRGLHELGPDRNWVPLTSDLPAATTGADPFGAFKAAQAARFGAADGVLMYGSAAGLYTRSGDGTWRGPIEVASTDTDVIRNPVDSVAVAAGVAEAPVYLVSIRGRGLFFSHRPDGGYAAARLDAGESMGGDHGSAPARTGTGESMPGVRWIVPADRARESGVVFAASPERLFRSADGGQSWVEVARPR